MSISIYIQWCVCHTAVVDDVEKEKALRPMLFAPNMLPDIYEC